MPSLKELELLAAHSRRYVELEQQFEQVCHAAISAFRTSDDLVIIALGLVAELKSKGRSDVADKAIEYIQRNNLLPKREVKATAA